MFVIVLLFSERWMPAIELDSLAQPERDEQVADGQPPYGMAWLWVKNR
jgi:hypothetical protein